MPSVFQNADFLAALTLGFAAPGSITVRDFCSGAEKEEQLASHIAVLSTFLCIFAISVFAALTLLG